MARDTALTLFFDGGCRPNPGRMESAVVAQGQVYLRPDAGEGGSGTAEWRALLHALEVAATLGARDIVLVGDAANVVAQARGTTRCSPSARAELAAFRAAAAGFARVRLRAVKRSQNLAGQALEKHRWAAIAGAAPPPAPTR
ncbi:MAG TPA: reverse transcriptase-like protein [Sphingomonadaceae bacterium]|nr:reverse transcriptase-like protein [Sphingomonadaceae bacterium]